MDFEVTVNPPQPSSIVIPNHLRVVNSSIKNKVDQEMTQKSDKWEVVNKLPVSILFKQPVRDYTFTIVLKNKSLTDVRIFKVLLNVIP